MGIRDALRSLRGGEKKSAEGDEEIEAPEPTWFQPRYDGSYEAAGTDSTTAIRLRFLPGGNVFESDQADVSPGPDQQNPCRGEYTAAGRFNVQRKFERIISYAVLEMDPVRDTETGLDTEPGLEANRTGSESPPGFRARRINAADRSTVELHFRFRPDSEQT